MNAHRSYPSRPISLVVFAAIAALGAFVVMAQVSPQPTTPQANRQPANPAQPPQAQTQPPQALNQNQPTAPASANQAARDNRAPENPRQATRTDQGRNDSRQRQSGQEEQDAAWLGVYLDQREGEQGATVSHVYPSGPAARAGLYSGDVIQQINGQQVSTGKDLVAALEQLHAGDKADLSVLRNNEPTKLTATLGSRDSFVFRGQNMDRFGGRDTSSGQHDENEDLYNIPLHAMELEHNRRMAEQHQRIETEIAKLRDEVRQLREALQRR